MSNCLKEQMLLTVNFTLIQDWISFLKKLLSARLFPMSPSSKQLARTRRALLQRAKIPRSQLRKKNQLRNHSM